MPPGRLRLIRRHRPTPAEKTAAPGLAPGSSSGRRGRRGAVVLVLAVLVLVLVSPGVAPPVARAQGLTPPTLEPDPTGGPTPLADPRIAPGAGVGGALTPPPDAAGHTARGLLVPVQETTLAAELDGQIVEIPVRDGDAVTEGQRLAALDCRIHDLRRDRHEAEARAAGRILGIQRKLASYNSGNALDAATAEADLNKARVDIAIAEALIERCVLTAPFSGRIVEVKVKAYQHVGEGQEVLSLLNDRTLEVDIIVPSRWLVWLGVGTPFTLVVDETGSAHPGHIQRLGARVDPASQSVKVVGVLDGDTAEPATTPAAAILAGMSGSVRFDP